MIRTTEQEEGELIDYSQKFPGIRGELEFDWTVTLLGQSVTRKGRVTCQHTPDWEYFDLLKNSPYKGWDSSSYRTG